MTAGRPVAVLGAGSWGTALAIHLTRLGVPTVLWGRDGQRVEEMARARHNPRYLSDVVFPDGLRPTADLGDALADRPDVILAVPCKGLRPLLERMPPLAKELRYICACKGLETGTRLLASEVVTDVLGDVPVAALTGPSFAAEVAAGLPTAVSLASVDRGFSQDLVALLHGGSLRAYTIDDIVGAEVGGACKNVMAIAAGVADGLKFGANARAALITRGLAEITRLGIAMGGQATTFMGLAGLGDLVLTCTDDQSRNRRMGLALAEGLDATAAEQRIGQVVEGVNTAFEVLAKAAELGVEMPIAEQVVRLLEGRCSPRDAVQALLARDPRHEFK
jgi:glycerol-3-phosphate dehydrogenase (NAD(P)+)